MRFTLDPTGVSIGDIRLETPPTLNRVKSLLSADARLYQKGSSYLPTAIFDALGIVVRYRAETGLIALIDIHFATSCSQPEPQLPFKGEVLLNGKTHTRPTLLRDLELGGPLPFDNKPVPASFGAKIGVSITPKFEYVGVITVGWKGHGLVVPAPNRKA